MVKIYFSKKLTNMFSNGGNWKIFYCNKVIKEWANNIFAKDMSKIFDRCCGKVTFNELELETFGNNGL